jgi:hypothetical protein
MRQRGLDGRSMIAEADALIKPNSRLTSFERLEIYNRQYWFRVLSCFGEDFPGLRAIIGSKRFDGLTKAYLLDCPSQSFTLRNLGSRLELWLGEHGEFIAGFERIAMDMVRLEWAHIEAFDELAMLPLAAEDIAQGGLDLRVQLQPHVRLLHLAYPVDDLLIEVRQYEGGDGTAVNAARLGHFRRRVRSRILPEPEDIYLAVHRHEDSVYYKRLEREAFEMLRLLRDGRSLEEAIEMAFIHSRMAEDARPPALQEWFANWSELGWLCRR